MKAHIDDENYLILPENWRPEMENPFSVSGGYEGFTALLFSGEEDGRFSYGTSGSGLFSLVLHRFVLDLEQRVYDFIDYERRYGRKVLMGRDFDFDIRSFLAHMHCETNPYKIRKSDPTVLVHSTTTKAWQSIKKDMTLKSPRRLSTERISYQSIGFHGDEEPEEYGDFVMFGGLGTMPEFMFQAQQYGRIMESENEYYDPGIRLYLDAHKMIKDKIISRDGIHQIKVRDSLELRDYLLFTYTVENESSPRRWTPKSFADECDKWFHRFTQGKFSEK